MEAAEAEVVEILIGLRELVPARRRRVLPPRWGDKRRRSDNSRSNCVPKEGTGRGRLSPATPLSFSPSSGGGGGGDDDDASTTTTAKMSRHKQWLEEQNRLIRSLISARSHLQKSVEEAKRRYQMLRERNSWLKNLQAETETMKKQQRRRRRRRPALDPNRSAAAAEEEAVLAWERRMVLSAQARKRRMLLQRAKFSSSSSPSLSLSFPRLMIGDIF